jgi:predicted nucleic acid-binding protein
MLFIYLLEGNETFSDRVEYLLNRSKDRGDLLFTSNLALGEVLVGANKFGGEKYSEEIPGVLREMGFSFLSFDSASVKPFSRLRSVSKTKVADSINLACAASAGIDLFITGDTDLPKLHVPGIHFIADINTPLL